MGVDKSTDIDTGIEQAEDENPSDRHPPQPSDQPGQEPGGVPSRLEVRKARAAAKEQSAEKPAEETDKKRPAEATPETNETDKPTDASKPPQDTSEQRIQDTETEDADTSVDDRAVSETNPETSETKQGQDSDHESAENDTYASPLERMPSQGGFANLAEEFEARAKGREIAKQYNAELPKDGELGERREDEMIFETSQDQGSLQDDKPKSDEPGSWRGEGDQYLNAEENLVTGHALDRIQEKESAITEDLKTVESDTDGNLVGLEYRVKGEGRFKEKVAEGTREYPELPINEIAESEHDAIRYTYQFDKHNYVQGYQDVRRGLEERGYELVACRNFWDNLEYKGINTRWRTSEGQLFEVQFHTPESFRVKQETHSAYERLRNPETISDQEHEWLRGYQREMSTDIPIPDGAGTIEDFRKV